ncbi:hypothetical protein [Streptosporangium sp. NPDC001681]|uniref:hypothetical protein n=1 Tax=Streptosporangium sp. NPDC001681 TaxID=3154395 RepID=UPI00331B1888
MRPQWEDLPRTVQKAIEERVGSVLKAEPAGTRPGAGVAVFLHTEDGSTFLKALPRNSHTELRYGRERRVSTVFCDLPPGLPVPQLLWSADLEGWLVLLYQDLGGRPANLSPGSPDIPLFLNTVTILNRMLTPCPAMSEAPPIAENLALIHGQAELLLATMDLSYRALFGAALKGVAPEALAGDTLLHYDLTPRNLRVVEGRAYATSWVLAARGAAWVEAAMLCPRLILAGHSASQAEALLGLVPAWRNAPKGPVTALAALWTLRRLHKARFGPYQERESSARSAAAGRDWLLYRTMGRRT